MVTIWIIGVSSYITIVSIWVIGAISNASAAKNAIEAGSFIWLVVCLCVYIGFLRKTDSVFNSRVALEIGRQGG